MDRRGGALAGLGLLYLTQGLPMGLAFEALPALMRQQGHSPASIGLVGLAILPWALRFLWAPWIDRWSQGRRRSWLAALQLGTAGLYGLVILAGGLEARGSFALAVVCLASLVSATQNTVTDAYVVRTLPREMLGWANGLQVGGFALGMLLGGGLVLLIYGSAGWALAWLLPVAVALAALLRLPDMAEGEQTATEVRRIGLGAFLARPGAGVMLSLAATFYFGRAFVGDMMSVVLVDAGFDMRTIGALRMVSTGAMAAGAMGAAGFLIARLGVARVAPVAGLVWAAILVGWAVFQGAHMPGGLAATLCVLDGLVGGVTYAAFLTIFMRWASQGQAGVDVTTLMCTESLSNMGATVLGGLTAGAIGFVASFQLAAGVMALAMLWTFVSLRGPQQKDLTHAQP